jgi:hypothetical protein
VRKNSSHAKLVTLKLPVDVLPEKQEDVFKEICDGATAEAKDKMNP